VLDSSSNWDTSANIWAAINYNQLVIFTTYTGVHTIEVVGSFISPLVYTVNVL